MNCTVWFFQLSGYF